MDRSHGSASVATSRLYHSFRGSSKASGPDVVSVEWDVITGGAFINAIDGREISRKATPNELLPYTKLDRISPD